MILAAVSSGRSLLAISRADEAATGPLSATAASVSTARRCRRSPPPASKPVVRTVITLIASVLCTVAIALPA